MLTKGPLRVIVVGAGLTGLTTSLLLARAGHTVTVLDRDPDPPPDSSEACWDRWQRPGVNQFRHAHLMLPRWHHELTRELPELADDLLARGARLVNTLHLQSPAITGGRQPGDEQFDTIAARRPVVEAALSRLADRTPRLTVCRGARVLGLVTGPVQGLPHVHGVLTGSGTLTADLVVDAGGRHTTVPGLVRDLGVGVPAEVREPCGFVYYGRHFRTRDRQLPHANGLILTHHPSLSVLTLPGDLGTFCIVLIASSRDRTARALRHGTVWSEVARLSPAARPWFEAGEAITDVMPIAGIEDTRRDYVVDGEPLLTGLVCVGDSFAATNPSLGRGAAIGVLHACLLRDALADSHGSPRELVETVSRATAEKVTPWIDATLRFDRHRLAEMDADRMGVPYLPEDPAWTMTTALGRGASQDPVLARAYGRVASLLANPAEVLSVPDIQHRLGPHLVQPRYSAEGPTRADIERALGARQLA